MEQEKTLGSDKVFGAMSWIAIFLIGLMVVISLVMAFYFVRLAIKSANQEILISPQIEILKPLLKEVETEIQKNNGKIPETIKSNNILEQKENGDILVSGYKDGNVYLNTVRERNNYYLDKKLLIMQPVVSNKEVKWNCYFVQAGKVLDNEKYNCKKTSETIQQKKFNKVKVDLAPELWKDREILKKFYEKKDGVVPQELMKKISEEKKFIERHSKKSDS